VNTVRILVAVLAAFSCFGTYATENIFSQGSLTPYTETQLKAFHAFHMQKVLEEGLMVGKHPVPELNARYIKLMEMVKKRYGMYPTFTLSPSYDKTSRERAGTSGIINRVPTVGFIVPALWDYYVELQGIWGSKLGEAMFSNALIIGLLHELEHLGYGLIDDSRKAFDPNLDAVEAATWAHTCEETIRIFVEKGLPLANNERASYQVWVESGRNAASSKWQKAIKDRYESARKRAP
jgi:hypothetical protein